MAVRANQIVEGTRLDAGELFRLHGRFVANFLWRMGVERQELDDLLQEVFIVAHRRGGFVEGQARPTTWLADIAIRVASTRRRGWRRRRDFPDSRVVAGQISGAPTPVERMEAAERLQRVRKALDKLDINHRGVLVLFEFEGESCEDIAAGLGIPVGTVYSRLHKARRQFTDAYEKLAPKSEGGRVEERS